ncbi:MAG TPA: hypothetical protein VED85_08000 [Burkholderiaceae bacterium]|nr:hypothetical protein [Burkholderiaceae bacterium]
MLFGLFVVHAVNSDFPSERAARNHRVLTLISALLFYALAYRLAWFAYGPVLGFVVCSPVLGAYVAWLLIHRAESWLFFPKWLALRKINGKAHFFDDRPLRIEEHDGGYRAAAEDIFGILGVKPSADTLRRMRVQLGEQGFFQDEDGDWWFAEAALLQWLGRRTERLSRTEQRLHFWLEREAFPVLRRKKTNSSCRDEFGG